MWLKSFFISAYICICLALTGFSIHLSIHSPLFLSIFSCITTLSFIVFLARIYLISTPRTPRQIPWLIALPATFLFITITCWYIDMSPWQYIVIALTILLGNTLYLFWYSTFDTIIPDTLTIGRPLPDFALKTLYDESFPSENMRKQPSLIIFYRGNWCAICSAQIKEMAANYRLIEQRGINIYMVSSQPNKYSIKTAQKYDAPMLFLHDPDNNAAAQLGIHAAGGTPMGLQLLGYDSDTTMPTAIMTDNRGIVFFADITDNYRVRPIPSDFLKAFDNHTRHSMTHT